MYGASKRPTVSLPAGEAGSATSRVNQSDEIFRNSDPVAPPYVPNLHVSDLRDESFRAEYGVLVRSIVSVRASAQVHPGK
jgi:ATP adenylyltransferase